MTSTVLQSTCILLVSAGLTIEAVTKGDVGWLLVTGGALAFAVATKIRYRLEKIKK